MLPLDVAHLTKRYGQTLAVDDVSFTVASREIVGLLGPNGAGKTTIISTILGVLEPTAGAINIQGLDVAHQRSRALAHTNFAAVYAQLPGNLSVLQNLRFFGLLYAVPQLHERIDTLLDEFQLRTLRNTRAGLLSSGEQTRLALAKAVLNRPQLLLLDEPTASLDPSAADTVRKNILAMSKQSGCGILWTSHNMYEVEEVCDRVLFLSRGKILLQGNPKNLPREHGMQSLEELFIHLAREPLAHGAEPER
jgi:ABC-2 type transport system ATP-binding protein